MIILTMLCEVLTLVENYWNGGNGVKNKLAILGQDKNLPDQIVLVFRKNTFLGLYDVKFVWLL